MFFSNHWLLSYVPSVKTTVAERIDSCNNHNSFPKQQILVSSKLKVFADNNFKFDETVESVLNR